MRGAGCASTVTDQIATRQKCSAVTDREGIRYVSGVSHFLTRTHALAHTHKHIHTDTHTHTNTHTHKHAHTHTHTHTHKRGGGRRGYTSYSVMKVGERM